MRGIGRIVNNISSNISGRLRLSQSIAPKKAVGVSNPFGVSFKGHIYKADLFESSNQKNKLSFAAKLVQIKDNFIYKMSKVGSFVKMQTKTLGDKISAFSSKIGTMKGLSFGGGAKEVNHQNVSKTAQKLAKRPVAELEQMLANSISNKGE